ncbi:MAG TPA: TylF/MycF/NovP-related O-methyltransferase [Candidatus Polarisedimenticolia bacterium]|nr:TylF/MycF/NovP-related O-methyltransferase [Candidatus Polarisedimenticolia bacterium]
MSLAGTLQSLLRNVAPERFYFEDAILTTHNHDFVRDTGFRNAYARGLKASGGKDNHNRWRIHVALWAARVCSRLEGDFIECGVNYGFTSSAIMEHLNWDSLGKQFWLVDSFSGVDERQTNEEEKKSGRLETSEFSKRTGFYNCDVERVRQNFQQWKNTQIIQGWIPDCLDQVQAAKIAFMHIDLNSAAPEIQAFKYFLPKLSPGAIILLDDYAYVGFDATYSAWNSAGKELDFEVLSMPTGQGMIQVR